ncbi:MAG: VOC family protein [Bacteroidota bacterium]
MKLGAFSISLGVKDLKASKEFYEKMGLTHFAGSMEENYLILKNDHVVIGLFYGMFEGNVLTFNPGWNQSAENIEEFNDVREIFEKYQQAGLSFVKELDDSAEGPNSFMMTDPDGNVILFDQHR